MNFIFEVICAELRSTEANLCVKCIWMERSYKFYIIPMAQSPVIKEVHDLLGHEV